MRRRVMRRDANHDAIVSALRAAGISVHDTHTVGGGFPDLVVGCRGITTMLEVKMPMETLEPHQRDWHAAWRGSPVLIARTIEEAIAVVHESTRRRVAA